MFPNPYINITRINHFSMLDNDILPLLQEDKKSLTLGDVAYIIDGITQGIKVSSYAFRSSETLWQKCMQNQPV